MKTAISTRDCTLHNCRVIDYQTAWIWQKSLQQERIDNPNIADALVLLEHPPVYTLDIVRILSEDGRI